MSAGQGVLASLAWGAVFALGLLLPYLLKILTGMESELTRNALAVARVAGRR